jgi:hypothetical protein
MTNQKSSVARLGGISLHIKHDSNAIAARARAGLEKKFFQQAREMFPDLDDDALLKKAGLLKKAHFVRMGIKSAKSRAKKISERDSELGAKEGGASE